MKKSKLIQKTITKLVEASFKDGRLVESQVVKSIKALKSLPIYEAIQALSEYLNGIKREERKHTMYIETVVSLSLIQIQKAKKIVEKKARITKVVTNINPEILGGFKLKIGDEIWDESLVAKINQVKEVIISGRSNQPD